VVLSYYDFWGKEASLIQPNRLINRIVDEVRDRIVRGEFKEGQKLSSQDKLAQKMGVSRVTLREALHQLMLMGLIEMRQGSGTYIKSITPSTYMNALSPALLMDRSSVNELLEARFYIESTVASLAAERALPKEVLELKKILDAMKADLQAGNLKDFAKRDVEFHMQVAKSAKNRVMLKVVQTIREILFQFIADFFSAMPDTVYHAINYHNRIVHAIEQGDGTEAKKRMEAHIRSLIRRVNQGKKESISRASKGKGDSEGGRMPMEYAPIRSRR
jgi:GntR family transcriptional regulator, transcriptional repressor for pyruvate dehydrogenase complex